MIINRLRGTLRNHVEVVPFEGIPILILSGVPSRNQGVLGRAGGGVDIRIQGLFGFILVPHLDLLLPLFVFAGLEPGPGSNALDHRVDRLVFLGNHIIASILLGHVGEGAVVLGDGVVQVVQVGLDLLL